ncbi:hypothetical protein GF359_08270, partial [candidate division WOR-3 bacterium]|nr:hypothetical protein [candidate division WOR-3 bacterium]MBD3365196.1 hypothetical protein [candidate division WOR-3 bacterium]
MNLVLMLVMLTVPATETVDIEPYPFSTWFESLSTPQPVKVEGNPLDFCGARIGLDVRDIELPRGWEGGYRFAARFPIIDYVSNRPLYMKQWAEDNAREIISAHEVSGLSALFYAQNLLRGTREYPEVSELYVKLSTQYIQPEVQRFVDALSESGFTQGYKTMLIELYLAYLTASYYLNQSSADLSDEEIELFLANPGYFIAPDGKRMPSLTGDVCSQFEFIERARRVEYKYIWIANYILSEAVEKYLYVTSDSYTEDFYQDISRTRNAFIYETPHGAFIVSGVSNDALAEDAAIVIDLGGDDFYEGKQASGIMQISLIIDHKGNDTYEAVDINYTQGFGFMGLGYLIDLEGDDVYKARHFSQGAGILGVGAIWDAGGNDSYDAHAFCQGAGAFGLGIILDDE